MFEEIKVLDWCPSALSLSRYCGGYRNLCEMVGLEINQSIFGRPRYLLKSKNGDKCLSYAEQAVTNFFIDNNIKYEKEVKYSRYIKDIKNEKFCDWVLEDNTLVEYFGMMDKDYYAKKANKKLKLIKDHNLKFIELREKDLPNLMEIFKDYII